MPPEGGDWSLYPYGIPNRGAANFFYAIFFSSCVMHLVQLFQFGIARYSALLPWGAALYTAGFVLRQVSSFHNQDLGLYIASTVLLYAAPPVYAAVNYLVLGRVLHYVPSKSPIHPGRVVTTYLALDLLVEVLTGQGGWRIADYQDPDNVNIGKALIETSLILQVVLYISFVALQTAVYRRCAKDGVKSLKFRYSMRIMFISTAFILIRSTYRVIDAFLGYQGYTASHEWCLYVFDATPLLLNSWMLNIWHPSVFLPPSSRVYLGADGVTERMGPGWTDKRPFLATLFDPFDIAGIISKRDHRTRFWEEEDKHPLFAPNLEKESPTFTCQLVFRKIGLGYLGDLYVERCAQKKWLKENATATVSQA
jgi:RTA1 like protein